MLQVALAGATSLLVAAGAYQLWTGRLTGSEDDVDELMVDEAALLAPSDFRDPRGLLDDGAKLRNLLMVAMETAILMLSTILVLFVAVQPDAAIAVEYKALLGVCFLVGTYLLGRALYVRLGLFRAFEGGGPTHDAVEEGSD